MYISPNGSQLCTVTRPRSLMTHCTYITRYSDSPLHRTC